MTVFMIVFSGGRRKSSSSKPGSSSSSEHVTKIQELDILLAYNFESNSSLTKQRKTSIFLFGSELDKIARAILVR